MTLFHFFNCAALTFGPHAVYYKATPLSEYDTAGACIKAALVYLGTALVKEVLKALIGFLDVAGLYFAPGQEGLGIRTDPPQGSACTTTQAWTGRTPAPTPDLKPSWGPGPGPRSQTRPWRCEVDTFSESPIRIPNPILALGRRYLLRVPDPDPRPDPGAKRWAFADSLVHRLAPLWFGARGLEFTWDYLLRGLESNANLVFTVSLAALGSLMWLRKNKPAALVPFVYASAGLVATMPSITSYLQHGLHWNFSKVVGFELAASLVVAFVTWRLYNACQRPS
ncbi:hypothetical protein R1sor_013806 [Riccia sorocarpa]|uniref:BOS complex subunit TMEM147 n=1 Tax=Riccia sorocarpa TaxID=122646 RepID=A0ABD3H7M9_9MARC